MAKPFMIHFPFKGRGCYANVYTHDGALKEYHIHLIDSGLLHGIPLKITLLQIEGKLHLAEPLNLSKTVLAMVVEEIERKRP